MIDTLYAIKKLNTQTWDKQGNRLPITILEMPELKVTQVKTADKHGYSALQVGFGVQKVSRVNQPIKGHLKLDKQDKQTVRYLKEIPLSDSDNQEKSEFAVGLALNISDYLAVGDIVNVTARSKGTGFTGVMKRWNFSGGPRTHGQSDRERAPGSIGQGTDPGRVWKGKKMAGRSGHQKVTQQNLMVVKIDPELKEIWVKGTTPGFTGSLITLKKTTHKEFVGLHSDKPETPDNQVPEENTNEAKS